MPTAGSPSNAERVQANVVLLEFGCRIGAKNPTVGRHGRRQ
jgi:hypothetical protein